MKSRPILFSAPMVIALLAGTKTQTRRIVKPVGKDHGFVVDERDGFKPWPYRSDDGESVYHTVVRNGEEYQDQTPHECPYGRRGDQLWVKETHARTDKPCAVHYRADDPLGVVMIGDNWKSSIHMPRWASRITLEITNVRVERLNEISEEDAKSEGCNFGCDSLDWYRETWESINGPGSWALNPWVWVVEFKRLEQESSKP